MQNLDRVRQPERLGAWLARTARNECLHVLRGWGRETPVEEDALRALIPDVDDDADDDSTPPGSRTSSCAPSTRSTTSSAACCGSSS